MPEAAFSCACEILEDQVTSRVRTTWRRAWHSVLSPHFSFSLRGSRLKPNCVLDSLCCFRVLAEGVRRLVTLLGAGETPVLAGGRRSRELGVLLHPWFCQMECPPASPRLEDHSFKGEWSGFLGRPGIRCESVRNRGSVGIFTLPST